LGFRRGANDTTPENFTVRKPWRRPRPTQSCSASEEEEETNIKQAAKRARRENSFEGTH
jgi:hypothetical protein